MSTATEPRASTAASADGSRQADALVIFGITGDLAKVMTFRSLYRLERRGLLDCPIVGVAGDDWTVEQLREHARESHRGHRGERSTSGVYSVSRHVCHMCSGDFADAATYKRVSEAIGGAHRPVFYLEIPPFLFATVIKALTEAGLTANARVVVEKPFGHDLHPRASSRPTFTSTSTSRSSIGSTTSSARWACRSSSICGSRIRGSSRCGTATTIAACQITMAEAFGVEDRGHFYDPVGALRDVVVNHLMQLLAAAAMEAPAGADAATLKDAKYAVFRSMPEADPAHYVRGQYDGYLEDRRRRRRLDHRDLRRDAAGDR